MNSILRKMTLSTAVLLAVNVSAFADAGQPHGHEAFASKSDAHTHGSEAGNVRTGDNSIEIYGKLYMSLGYSDPGINAPETIELSSHGSVLGVRGNKPLSEDIRLFWQIESLIDVDNMGTGGHDSGGNTSLLAGSDSFVGLSGNTGTLLFGKHNTPLTMLVHANDPFMHIAGDALSILGHVGHHYQSSFDPDHGTMFYVRAPNSIMYMSPEVGGFSTNVALIAIDESTQEGARIPGTSLSLNFKSGGFNLAYAFERHNELDHKTSHTVGADPELLDKSQVHVLSAMVHFPTTMVNVTVEQLKVADDVDGNHKRWAYHLSVQQMFGLHSLRAAYAHASDFGDHASGASDGAQMLAVGWFQALSSTTQAYVALASTQNKPRGDFGTFFVHEISRGADPTTLATGLIHYF